MTSQVKFGRLHDSISWSQRQLEFPRNKRAEAIRQYVGLHAIEHGSLLREPVNFIALATQIYVRQLAARSPRAMFTAENDALKPTAADMELVLNKIPDEIGLDDTLRTYVLEALYSMGIVKVGLHPVDKILGQEYGKTFVDIVTLNDYFFDMSASRFDDIDYEGNGYWVDYETAMKSEWGRPVSRTDIKPDDYTSVGEHGEERANSAGVSENDNLYRDKLRLRDVFLPRERRLLTYAVTSKIVMNDEEWEGPERGMYRKLRFSDIPDNILPLPPIAIWRDIHELANSLFRKLGEQADGQKSVLGFTGGDDDAVDAFKNASDGDGITWTGRQPEELKAGGIDPRTFAFFVECQKLFSYFGGNLDVLGGLAPMTQTVGQDKLLGEAAGAQLRDMAARTVKSVREIFQDLAYYEWNDPVKDRLLKKPIPGTDETLPVPFGSKDKKGKFSDYEVDIDVYSLPDDSPAIRLQKLGQIMQQYVLPLAPLIESAGGVIDAQKILEIVGKYSDFKDLGDIVSFVDQPSPAGKPSGMPQHTVRESVRTGRPGQTKQGADDALKERLLTETP